MNALPIYSPLKNFLKQSTWLRNSYYSFLVFLGYLHEFGKVKGLSLFFYLKKNSNKPHELQLKGYAHNISLRGNITDLAAFNQIIPAGHYSVPATTTNGCIIDAGAYIGLSSVYFATHFPEKKIIAIEPDEGNFKMLQRNTAGYKNIVAYRGAVWNAHTMMTISNPDATAWAYQMKESMEKDGVPAFTIDEIMKRENVDEVSILKIDVEGAEKEIFSTGAGSWLPYVHCIIIELHDRFKKGCRDAVETALASIPHSKAEKGENTIYFLKHPVSASAHPVISE